jgi:hypothetical protein
LRLTTHQFNDLDLIVHQDIHGSIWFRGTQICNILGFANSSETLRTHVNDYLQELAIGQGKPALYVAEKGLYILCFKAKTPAALEFQLWAADVIQTIRKTGQYTATAAHQQHFAPFGITLQLKIDECDRCLEAAVPGVQDIPKILRAKQALEAAYKKVPKEKPDQDVYNDAEQKLGELLAAWHNEFGEKPLLLKIALEKLAPSLDIHSIKYVFRIYQDKVVNGFRLKASGKKRQNGILWMVTHDVPI